MNVKLLVWKDDFNSNGINAIKNYYKRDIKIITTGILDKLF